MKKPPHPEKLLFGAEVIRPTLTPCDHYAGNLKFAQKAVELQKAHLGRFDITCDLEDGAKATNSSLRDDFIALSLSNQGIGHAIGIRIQDLQKKQTSMDVRDIVMGCGEHIAHITVPKVRSAQQLKVFLTQLRGFERKAKLRRNIPVHVLIETLSALEQVELIARLPNLRCLEFGLMDFVSEHFGRIPGHCMSSPGQFEHPLLVRAKCAISSAAAAHNIDAAHNVTVAFQDAHQTYRDARRARLDFGFTRMWSIHPDQILPIIQAFTPSTAEIEMAASIIAAANEQQWGPVKVNGQLHDRASYRYYWHILKQANSLKVTLPSYIQAWFKSAN
jgi:citrate lyase subunit beta/citryl-CoA lyase